jgi:prolyl-tRNA editing enzyme YbaK/EbsC (Cys-tRNA(Pro) deacylase)
MGQPVRPANPEDVWTFTGYPVGSVPPIGMKGDFPVVMDIDLFSYEHVWAAAGSARILVRIRPIDLEQISRGQVEKIN